MSKLSKALKRVAANRNNSSFIKFFKIPSGKTRVRILPAAASDDKDDWFIPVGQHYNVDKYAVLCPSETNWAGDDCVICQAVSGLRAKGDTDKANEISMRRSFYVRAIVRNNSEATGVQFLRLPSTLFEAIGEIMEEEDYGDVLSPTEGRDIVIKKEGQGFDTKYTAMAKVATSPLAKSKGEIKEIIDSLESFPPMVTPPSEKELLELLLDNGLADEEDDYDEDYEEGDGDDSDVEENDLLADPEDDDEDDSNGDEEDWFEDEEEGDEPDEDSENSGGTELTNSLASSLTKRKKRK